MNQGDSLRRLLFLSLVAAGAIALIFWGMKVASSPEPYQFEIEVKMKYGSGLY